MYGNDFEGQTNIKNVKFSTHTFGQIHCSLAGEVLGLFFVDVAISI